MGGAPNTWIETGPGHGREERRKVCTSKGNLDLTGINWDRLKQENIRRMLMNSGSGWMSCTSLLLCLCCRGPRLHAALSSRVR